MVRIIVARKSGVMGAWWDLGHRSYRNCTYIYFLLNAMIGHICCLKILLQLNARDCDDYSFIDSIQNFVRESE